MWILLDLDCVWLVLACESLATRRALKRFEQLVLRAALLMLQARVDLVVLQVFIQLLMSTGHVQIHKVWLGRQRLINPGAMVVLQLFVIALLLHNN